jgi:hypothetical protein
VLILKIVTEVFNFELTLRAECHFRLETFFELITNFYPESLPLIREFNGLFSSLLYQVHKLDRVELVFTHGSNPKFPTPSVSLHEDYRGSL